MKQSPRNTASGPWGDQTYLFACELIQVRFRFIGPYFVSTKYRACVRSMCVCLSKFIAALQRFTEYFETSLSLTCKGTSDLLGGLKTVFPGLCFTPKLPSNPILTSSLTWRSTCNIHIASKSHLVLNSQQSVT